MAHPAPAPALRVRLPAKTRHVTGQVQSLTRGLNILETLAKTDGGITLTDLAHRSLAIKASRKRDPPKVVTLGHDPDDLAAVCDDQRTDVRIDHPLRGFED